MIIQASGNSALAQALYQEYVRQDEAAQAAAAAAQEQANWEAQFAFTRQQYDDSLAADNRNASYNLAMTMLEAGLMPDSSTLEAAGISSSDALSIRQSVLQAQQDTPSRTTSTVTNSGGGSRQPTSEIENAEIDMQSVLSLGYGPITASRLAELEEAGEIESYLQNGMIRFRRLSSPTTGTRPSSFR